MLRIKCGEKARAAKAIEPVVIKQHKSGHRKLIIPAMFDESVGQDKIPPSLSQTSHHHSQGLLLHQVAREEGVLAAQQCGHLASCLQGEAQGLGGQGGVAVAQ